MPTRSQAAVDLIKRSEDEPGFLAGACTKLTAYQDSCGVWTIGWGSTKGVKQGMTISAPLADVMLNEAIATVEWDLRSVFWPIKDNFSQGQWDALVSLCYNLAGGPRALKYKAPKLYAAIMAGDKQAAAKEFLDINKAGGVVLPGLTERRQREAELYVS